MKLQYPKNEIVWTVYYSNKDKEKPTFIITSKSQRDYYHLYKRDGDKFVKLGRAASPEILEKKFKIDDALSSS